VHEPEPEAVHAREERLVQDAQRRLSAQARQPGAQTRRHVDRVARRKRLARPVVDARPRPGSLAPGT
jgi:hypothetical protein